MMKTTQRLALCAIAALATATAACKTSSDKKPETKESAAGSTPKEVTPTVESTHYVGGETVTETGILEATTETAVDGSTIKAIVLTVSTGGTTARNVQCRLTLGATAPALAKGSPITITGKINKDDTNAIDDCAMLAK